MVLAILSVVAIVAISGFSRQPAGLRTEWRVADLRAEILAARQEAIASGQMVDWRPADAEEVGEKGIRYQPAKGSARFLRFHADGSSNGGIVLLGDRRILAIDWLTGDVRRVGRAD